MEKKILKIFIIINALLFLYAFLMPFGKASSGPTIESCDGVGVPKDTFYLNDYVYVKGSSYDPSSTCDFYMLRDEITWTDGMTIPSRISGTPTSVSSDSSGDVLTTIAWVALFPGKYDILVDFNGDGYFNEGLDALDDSDVQVTTGFFVITEIPFGTLLSLGTCIFAFVMFKTTRSKK